MSRRHETVARVVSPAGRGLRGRRNILLALSMLLGASMLILAFITVVQTSSNADVSVLVGGLSSDRLGGLAVVVGFAVLAVGLCLIPVPGWWLAMLIPARLVAIGAAGLACFAWWITASVTVVPLVSDACETGYVVEESSILFAGSGTVYRQDGILVTAVERTIGDDGYHPFFDGAYAVEDAGGSLHVWYNVNRAYDGSRVSTAGDPAFTLPKVTGQAFSCDVANVAYPREAPSPLASAPAASTVQESQDGLREMADVSIAASVAPVRGENNEAIDLEALEARSTDCGDGGARLSLTIDFHTGANAESLGRILAAWDAAGYAPDRAMQDDIRYSDLLPVERMSIRDSTTIDGLIHMQMTSRCSTGG